MHILKKKKMNSVAIVASTLPLKILNRKIKSWKIKKIYLPKSLYKSYLYIKDKNPDIELYTYGTGIDSFISLLLVVLSIKLTKKSLYFFHECCFLSLDLLLLTIKPNGHYYPQVTMAGFHKIKINAYKGKLSKYLLWHQFFRKNFKFFKSWEGYKEPIYAISVKNYPKNIISHDFKESLHINSTISNLYDIKSNNKILILSSKDIIKSSILKEFYINLAKELLKHNILTFQKDHPRKNGRLNLNSKFIENIDPSVPAEFLTNDYSYAISLASTALIGFKDRAISTIYLHDLDKVEREQRKSHLYSLDLGKNIFYPKSLEDLINIVKGDNS